MDDPFNLGRFVEAQRPIYDHALAELKGGQKQSHWMWFVSPQLAGLGHSQMARHYAIYSPAEARAYLERRLPSPSPRGSRRDGVPPVEPPLLGALRNPPPKTVVTTTLTGSPLGNYQIRWYGKRGRWYEITRAKFIVTPGGQVAENLCEGKKKC